MNVQLFKDIGSFDWFPGIAGGVGFTAEGIAGNIRATSAGVGHATIVCPELVGLHRLDVSVAIEVYESGGLGLDGVGYSWTWTSDTGTIDIAGFNTSTGSGADIAVRVIVRQRLGRGNNFQGGV